MRKIIAIGGGSLADNKKINREIINLANKPFPKLLIIPTAGDESEKEITFTKDYFESKFKCVVDYLKLKNERTSFENLEKRILSNDIIYVCGGNTLKMLKIWRKNKLDIILKKAWERGIILSGISAGAICWFKNGNSDSLKFSNKEKPLIKIRGLNFIPYMICPHYDSEKERRPSLHNMVLSSKEKAFALEDGTAIAIIDNSFKILKEKANSKAYLVYPDIDNNVIEKEIFSHKNFSLLADLLKNST